MEKTVSFESNNGLDQNVRKFKALPPRPVALDVEQSHNTLNKLSELERKLEVLKIKLQTRQKCVYNDDHTPKVWADDEINYLKENLMKIDQLSEKLTSLYCSISNTYKQLSSRFMKDSVALSERKRVAIRKKEQRKKNKKRKAQAGKIQAFKLALKTHGLETADALNSDSLKEGEISVAKLGSIKLLQRFHIKALRYMIDKNLVDDKEKCEGLHDILVARMALQRKKENTDQTHGTDSTESEEESKKEEHDEESDAIQIDDE